MKAMCKIILFFLIPHLVFSADYKKPLIVLGEGSYFFGSSFEGMFKQLPKPLYYPRDYSFPLAHRDGIQYVPRNITKQEYRNIFNAQNLITIGFYQDEYGFDPKEKLDLLVSGAFSSDSFVEQSDKLIKYFKEHHISYKEPGKTIIEGGNIFFVTLNGKTKVIVGDHSLIATYLVMGIGGGWPQEEIKRLARTIPEDSRLYYSVERNARLLMFKNLGLLKTDLLDVALSPVGANDREKFKEAALIVATRLLWCKQQIARELEVDLEDVIFIPQRSYHIDLDLLITSKNTVALRAPKPGADTVLWQLQKKILQQHVTLAEVPVNLTDPYMFCGFSIAEKNWYIFPNSTATLQSDFSQFLIYEGGFDEAIPFEGGEQFTKKRMGLHCLTQEYFINTDVTQKLSHTPNVGQESLSKSKVCAQCNAAGEMLRCGRCKAAFYCSNQCQKEHWSTHKNNCQPKS